MKVLVSAACLAIIAFVGFFFWERYADASQERLTSECLELRQRTTTEADFFDRPYDQELVDRCFDYFARNPVDGAL